MNIDTIRYHVTPIEAHGRAFDFGMQRGAIAFLARIEGSTVYD
jgi:hypothetical protein